MEFAEKPSKELLRPAPVLLAQRLRRLDRMHYELSVKLSPTRAEFKAMLVELERKLGRGRSGRDRLLAVLGVREEAFIDWFAARNAGRRPSRVLTRFVWLVWAMLCRPGAINSVWHLMTCGRMTLRGSPASVFHRVGVGGLSNDSGVEGAGTIAGDGGTSAMLMDEILQEALKQAGLRSDEKLDRIERELALHRRAYKRFAMRRYRMNVRNRRQESRRKGPKVWGLTQ